jgi:Putative beta-lactamase-inhibitor-like, PepSY-like
MKKIIVLLSVFLLISFMGFTQTITPEKVPAVIKEAFAKKFPAATDIKYGMEDKDYEFTFKDKGVGMSANFNSTGQWLETETIMIESDLPKKVLTSAATNFVGFMITEVTKVESPDKVVNYELHLKKNKEGYEVKFSPKGVILKKTKSKK